MSKLTFSKRLTQPIHHRMPLALSRRVVFINGLINTALQVIFDRRQFNIQNQVLQLAIGN